MTLRVHEAPPTVAFAAPSRASRRVSLLVPTLAGGGAERMMVNLAQGFLERGLAVDLVLVRAEGPYRALVPNAVRIVELGGSGMIASIPALVRYLRRERPLTLIATLNTANLAAIVAGRVARTGTRIVVRQSNTLSRTASSDGGIATRVMPLLVRALYPWADAVIAVSEGVANDLVRAAGVPRARLHVAPNPVVTSELAGLASEAASHPWFADTSIPVVLGAGRLIAQKDFETLIRAFAVVRGKRAARLVILGEGPERHALTALAERLGVADDVALPGFAANPFASMARARLFVLSSAWEGMPGVLIQALACGTPAISTDCESGPREILTDPGFGALVPVGNVHAMAGAIEAALARPRVSPARKSWERFSEDSATDAYLRVMGVPVA